jgi:menaquinone-dependent protoporphyrinogen oxidase
MNVKPSSRISRRRFLLLGGGAVGACAVLGTGLAALDPGQPALVFPQISYGENNAMNGKILVTYASRAGSTAQVAEAIGKTLAERGAQVDVRAMQDVTDVSAYRAVVAGSAIHGSKWLPEALRFVERNRSALAQRPFAAFMVSITLGMASAAQYREGLKSWMEPVRGLVRPVSEGYFAGSMDLSKLPWGINELMLRAVVSLGILPNGDHRDWNAIHAWAEELAAKWR